MTAIYRFNRKRLCGPPEPQSGQSNKPANQSKQTSRGRFPRQVPEGGELRHRVCRVQALGWQGASARPFVLRSGLIAELLPQPESVNMFFVHVPGRNLDIGPRVLWPGSCWPTLTTPRRESP